MYGNTITEASKFLLWPKLPGNAINAPIRHTRISSVKPESFSTRSWRTFHIPIQKVNVPFPPPTSKYH